MPGPPPDPTSARTRGEFITLPKAGRKGRPPKLQRPTWSDQARDQWKKWWSSPMATMWSIDDATELERMLGLYERIWNPNVDEDGMRIEVPVTVHAEIRQVTDRFGLSPEGRRKHGWLIEGMALAGRVSSSPTEKKAAIDSVPKAGGSNDPRLRMIEGGKAG